MKHRLPDDMRVGQVQLQVAHLERSVEYYRDVLGLRVAERTATSARLAAHASDESLVTLVARPGTVPVQPHGRLGLYHFALLLPDRPSLGRFLRHLIRHEIPFAASDHLVSEAIYLRDPNGLGIEVYADRPRAEWRVSDGQIQMATAPLDSHAVLAEAPGSRWEGAPDGTTMGHLHLHVGDISEASRFYHDALGLDRKVWSYPGALFLSAGGYHHHLGVNTWAGSAPPPSDTDARLLEWSLVLPGPADVSAVATRMANAGHHVTHEGTDVVTSDPWGTRLRLAHG